MKLKIISATILIICYSCNAQQKKIEKECYKTSWAKWIENELPESICVQKENMIYHLFKDFDFNQDGLKDLAIERGKKKLIEGMKTYLVIYKKVNDSTYVKFKTLDNIYPLWFSSYETTSNLKDSILNNPKQSYEMGNPLQEIEMLDNRIIMNLNADVGYKYILIFTFSKERNDWVLSEYLEYDVYMDIKTPYPNNKIGSSISDFSYEKFINGEY